MLEASLSSSKDAEIQLCPSPLCTEPAPPPPTNGHNLNAAVLLRPENTIIAVDADEATLSHRIDTVILPKMLIFSISLREHPYIGVLHKHQRMVHLKIFKT